MTRGSALGFEPITTSYWNDTGSEGKRYASLDRNISADVVVIGAGYTGLSAALHCLESGRSVAVLDAGQPGWAASGRNAAQLCPALLTSPADVEARLGSELGGRLNRAIAGSGQLVFDLIKKYGIDCRPRQTGTLFVARQEATLAGLAGVAQAMQDYGARIDLLDQNALRDFVTSDRYVGGVVYRDGGLIQPLSFARGLADAAARGGASIYGESEVVAVQRSGDRWSVKTASGEVTADTIIAGVGAYSRVRAFAELRSTGYPVVIAMLASHPLPDRGASILPRGGQFADADDKALFSPSIDPTGRLLVSALVGNGTSKRVLARTVNRRLARAFPQLEDIAWDRAWMGRVTVTPDKLPGVVRLGPNFYAGIACQGLGITYATLTGREMARIATGTSEQGIDLPVRSPAPAPKASVMPSLMRRVLIPLANHFAA